jgi:tRNA threonylcarbamoyladenosine biosynthesis protein TsaB
MSNDKTDSRSPASPSAPQSAALLLLGVDTCGPTGSVALARATGNEVEILEQVELEGRSYSATLVAAVAGLLARAGIQLNQLHAIVAANGPGSFTGVRVGLSAVKGFAEAVQTPVTAVSRLEVLAWKAGTASSALDAHRHELFLRLAAPGAEPLGVQSSELLAGPGDLAAIDAPASPIAVCDEAAAALLLNAWPAAEQVRVEAPMAADALQLCAARVKARHFVDLVLLDGNYLRRSDAEIFGEASAAAPAPTA